MQYQTKREKQVLHIVQNPEQIMPGLNPDRYKAMVKMVSKGGFDPAQDLKNITANAIETFRGANYIQW